MTMSGEQVCEVVEVGRNVESVDIGDRVVSYAPYDELRALSPGAWPAVDKNVALDAAISLPFAGTTLHCVRRARVVVGDNVAVIGQGPMGLLVTQWLEIAGAGQIIVTDNFEKRLQLAASMGATSCLNSQETDVYETVFELTDGRGADIVINATNSPQAFEFAMRLARDQGRVVVLSWHTHPITINDITQDFYNKELEIIATRAGGPAPSAKSAYVRWTGDESQKYIEKMAVSGRFAPGNLITHRFPLEDVDEALRTVEEKPESVVKAVLEW
jgi:2-desacetyl-2-hydroxyethyl bacteriochlorophyllide A dehydrogenase